MGERKVLNKYFPPDFDPNLIPKRKCFYDEQVKVRVMLPMTVQCLTCGEYIYRGKKFNARKEKVQNEDYLGIMIFRFYVHCTACSAEIVFKTDPKNSDYTVEAGAQRNFEPWKQKDAIKAQLEKEGRISKGDAMKELESKTVDSKREMDILDALEEIKEMNSRNAAKSIEEIMQDRENNHSSRQLLAEAEAEEEDLLLARSVFASSDGQFVRRLPSPCRSDDDCTAHTQLKTAEGPPKNAMTEKSMATALFGANSAFEGLEGGNGGASTPAVNGIGNGAMPLVIVKKKKKKEKEKKRKAEETNEEGTEKKAKQE